MVRLWIDFFYVGGLPKVHSAHKTCLIFDRFKFRFDLMTFRRIYYPVRSYPIWKIFAPFESAQHQLSGTLNDQFPKRSNGIHNDIGWVLNSISIFRNRLRYGEIAAKNIISNFSAVKLKTVWLDNEDINPTHILKIQVSQLQSWSPAKNKYVLPCLPKYFCREG